MRTYVIGRSRHADIVLAHESIAPRHAELAMCDEGRGFLTDRGAPGGTYRRIDASKRSGIGQGEQSSPNGAVWMPLRQDFVEANEPLRLGEMECTLRDLLRQLVEARSGDGRAAGGLERDDRKDHPPSGGRLERDPETGEIVRVAP